MPARDWNRKHVCDACAAHSGDGSARMPSFSDIRQQLEHCKLVIEQTLRRFASSDTRVVDDDDPYGFGPQGAD